MDPALGREVGAEAVVGGRDDHALAGLFTTLAQEEKLKQAQLNGT